MKMASGLKSLLIVGTTTLTLSTSAATFPHRVAYIGSDDQRANEYEAFLNQHFQEVTQHDRAQFKPVDATGADVVILDWPQGVGPFPPTDCPLGERAKWNKPTVLLGSAGLNVAVTWKAVGGVG